MCATDVGPALYCIAGGSIVLPCNVNRFRTAKLRPLFWKFFLNFWTYDPFSPRVQNLLASRQRGGMKSREVKQSREIKQSQTKQRSQTKSNKAHPRKNLESSANGQGNVGCRRCTSILHLIQLWICLCLYFYISICIWFFLMYFYLFLDQTSEIGVATATTQTLPFIQLCFFISLFDLARGVL